MKSITGSLKIWRTNITQIMSAEQSAKKIPIWKSSAKFAFQTMLYKRVFRSDPTTNPLFNSKNKILFTKQNTKHFLENFLHLHIRKCGEGV
jgi:hypothetical protein